MRPGGAGRDSQFLGNLFVGSTPSARSLKETTCGPLNMTPDGLGYPTALISRPQAVHVFLGGERRLVSTMSHIIVRDMLKRLSAPD
jgi:hypothetical protein